MTSLWELIAGPVIKIIDKVIPDVAARDAAKLELIKLQMSQDFKEVENEFQIALAQIGVNKAEAESSDFFRGGWRPAAGWVSVFGMGYMALVRPLLPWLVGVMGGEVPPLPEIDMDMLYVLLTGMLGLGGLRSFDKYKGTASKP